MREKQYSVQNMCMWMKTYSLAHCSLHSRVMLQRTNCVCVHILDFCVSHFDMDWNVSKFFNFVKEHVGVAVML